MQLILLLIFLSWFKRLIFQSSHFIRHFLNKIFNFISKTKSWSVLSANVIVWTTDILFSTWLCSQVLLIATVDNVYQIKLFFVCDEFLWYLYLVKFSYKKSELHSLKSIDICNLCNKEKEVFQKSNYGIRFIC